jgi:TRAP-type C4-dicarboxylate transport system permease small subunit
MSTVTDSPAPTDPSSFAAARSELLPRPRIRTGAVIWGVLLVAAGALALWIASSPARRSDAVDAVLGLDSFGWTVVAVIAAGGTLTLIALAAVIRSAQRRLARG